MNANVKKKTEIIVNVRKENGHVLRRTLDTEVGGQRKKVKLERTWKQGVG